MPVAHCLICLTNVSLEADHERFKVFPCGHGFCITCIDALFDHANRPKCPNCRKALRRNDAHPIYVEFINDRAAMSTEIVEGFEKMDANTPLVSIKKAEHKLGKVLRGSQPDETTMSALVRAVTDFNERITPVFVKVDSQMVELNVMREELSNLKRVKESLQTDLRKAEKLQATVTRLRTRLSETETNAEQAMRLAETANSELAAREGNTNQWKRRLAELEEENQNYKSMLEKLKNDCRTQKDKKIKLSKQVAALTEKLAERSKESDMPTDYDGDFSTHENSRIHRQSNVRSTSQSPRAHRHSTVSLDLDLEFDGIPTTKFQSDWQLEGGNVLKKKRVSDGHRRVGASYPLHLDRNGRPTKAIHIGPRSIIHIGR